MPNEVVEIIARVRSYWEVNDLSTAAQVAEQAVADAPWDGSLWEVLGLARQRVGNRPGARDALETASSLVPLSIPAQSALADCYLREGRNEAARIILVYLASRTDCPTAHLAELAAGLGRVGQLELALRMCRLASQREPDRDEPLYGMAYYMRRLRFPIKMIATVVAQAQRLDPTSMTYRMALAMLYAELGRSADALALVQEVRVDALQCRNCLEKLTRLFERVGDVARSARCRARLEELDDEGARWTPPCGPC